MNIFAWILSALGPLIIRGIIAAGFGILTFGGVMALFNQLVSMAQSSWSSLPAATIQLATLAGVPQALGIIMGAYAARFGIWASMNAAKYVLKT